MVKIQSATMTQINGMRINHINVFSSLHNTGVISISIVDKCCTGDAKHVKTGLVNIFSVHFLLSFTSCFIALFGESAITVGYGFNLVKTKPLKKETRKLLKKKLKENTVFM